MWEPGAGERDVPDRVLAKVQVDMRGESRTAVRELWVVAALIGDAAVEHAAVSTTGPRKGIADSNASAGLGAWSTDR